MRPGPDVGDTGTGMVLVGAILENLYRAFRPDLPAPGREDVKAGFPEMNLLPILWVDAVDISNAIVWSPRRRPLR